MPSSYFREACYKQLPSPGQWICSCSLANMLEEDFCRGCGGKSPARCEKDLAARAREEERLRLEEVARQERAQCGQLTAADLKFAHLEGRKMMPELRGYEEMPKMHRDGNDEAYINLLRFAAWKAGHQPQF